MDIRGKRFVVIGGAGLIGSHTVDTLLRHDIGELIVYDNFVRGTDTNLEDALRDDRVKVFEAGGDILQTDVLADALRGADGVFHFAALWLLHCHEYPRAAFLKARLAQGRQFKQTLWNLRVIQNVKKTCVNIGRPTFDRA